MKTIHNSRKRAARRELLPENERRVPAILRQEDAWLAGTAETAWKLLQLYPSVHMVVWPVNGPVEVTQGSLLQD